MKQHLENITRIINDYNNLTINSGGELSQLLKELTCELFYLEKHRSDYNEIHTKIMFHFSGSVSASKIEADNQVPELYMLRRVMNAAYRCVDALRSNISYIKKEQ